MLSAVSVPLNPPPMIAIVGIPPSVGSTRIRPTPPKPCSPRGPRPFPRYTFLGQRPGRSHRGPHAAEVPMLSRSSRSLAALAVAGLTPLAAADVDYGFGPTTYHLHQGSTYQQ